MKKLMIGKTYWLGEDHLGKGTFVFENDDRIEFLPIVQGCFMLRTNGKIGFSKPIDLSLFIEAEKQVEISDEYQSEEFIKEAERIVPECFEEFARSLDLPIYKIPEPKDLHETQKKQILDYLKTGKSITKLEALKMFGCWNSGDVIYKLRNEFKRNNEKFSIEMTMITNGKKRFASYKLIEK